MQILLVQGLILVLILIVYILTSHIIEKSKVRYLHESVVAILMGISIATILKYGFQIEIHFDHQLFFNLILPPIIFAAGYNLKTTHFFQNIYVILYQGLLCTILSFLILTTFAALLNELGLVNFGDDEIMLLTATLCATDTVAALTLVKEQYFPVLNSVLFGEGIVNDAISIVLFRSVQIYLAEVSTFQEIDSTIAFKLLLDFTYLLILSVIVGLLVGSLASYFFKKITEMTSIKEASIILLCGYSSYLIAEIFHLSGIISLFCCGLMMQVYSYPNLSEKSQQGTHLAFDTVGYLAEAFVFAYLGITTLEIPFNKIPLIFSCLMIMIIMFARFLTVFLLPCIMFILKKNYNLNMKELQVVWYSGLIRGAIAFALSFEIKSENAIDIRGCVLFIVLVTTCVGSIFLESFSQYINLKVHDENVYKQFQEFIREDLSTYSDIGRSSQNYKEIEQQKEYNGNGSSSSQSQYSKWEQFEKNVVRPIFQKKNQNDQPMMENELTIKYN